MSAPRIWVLVVLDDDGSAIRWNTAPFTPEDREALQEQADRMHQRAWVQAERD